MVLEIIKVAAISGLATSSSIFISWIVTNVATPERETDWRDIAFIGAIGASLGARYAVSGLPLFNRNY